MRKFDIISPNQFDLQQDISAKDSIAKLTNELRSSVDDSNVKVCFKR